MRKLGDRFKQSLQLREKKQHDSLTKEDRTLLGFAAEDAVCDAVDEYQGEDAKFSIKADTKKGVIKTLIKNGDLDSSKELYATKHADTLFKDFEWMAKNKSTVDRIMETAAELRSSTSIN